MQLPLDLDQRAASRLKTYGAGDMQSTYQTNSRGLSKKMQVIHSRSISLEATDPHNRVSSHAADC